MVRGYDRKSDRQRLNRSACKPDEAARRADRRVSESSDRSADDDHINDVVKLLKKVAEQKGHSKEKYPLQR